MLGRKHGGIAPINAPLHAHGRTVHFQNKRHRQSEIAYSQRSLSATRGVSADTRPSKTQVVLKAGEAVRGVSYQQPQQTLQQEMEGLGPKSGPAYKRRLEEAGYLGGKKRRTVPTSPQPELGKGVLGGTPPPRSPPPALGQGTLGGAPRPG